MKLLSIDASGKTAACAITDDSEVLSENLLNTGLTHSQTLLPEVDRILKASNTDIKDIDEFAVTVGPGSFTGLRIGLALVMGLAGNRPIHDVPTLLALAYNLTDKNGIIIPVLDARRSQVYTAVFKSENGKITRLEKDSADSIEAVLEKAKEYAKNNAVWILGDGAYLFEGRITEGINFADSLYPTGRGIAKAAREIEPKPAREIKLSYLRPSQAERELKERKK